MRFRLDDYIRITVDRKMEGLTDMQADKQTDKQKTVETPSTTKTH